MSLTTTFCIVAGVPSKYLEGTSLNVWNTASEDNIGYERCPWADIYKKIIFNFPAVPKANTESG